jgi:copper(I)-binding protein
MFMDPDATMLTVGETVEITLTFETAGDVTVEAEVRAG